MIPRKIRQTERSFFFLSSFGAASLLGLVTSFIVVLLLSVFSTGLSFSAGLWVFLFLFPGALAFSSTFIASKLEFVEMPSMVYLVIVGYGTYSIISLFILLMGGRNEPALWTLLVLALISVALFNTETILARFGIQKEAQPRDAQVSRELYISSSALPIKITPYSSEEDENTKPILSIKSDKDSSGKKESAHVDMQRGSNNGVIHLGPRS